MARFGFLLVVILISPSSLLAQRDKALFKAGNMQIKRQVEQFKDEPLGHHVILRDQINFGYCFEAEQYRRMPTTYYHPLGPLGTALKKYDWFPGAANTYHADARLPASLVALGVPGIGDAALTQLMALWSEPPVALIGLEAGTPAAYARPTQYFDFYEPTKSVIEVHEREAKDRFFHFMPDARARGAAIRVIHGSPRQELAKNGPRGFYRLMVLESCSGENGEKIFLDLFTKEGIAQCMEHLSDDGVLCVHTSHRYVDLPPVLAAIARDLKLHVRRGHDTAPGNERNGRSELAEIGHFTSEWVMIARHPAVLKAIEDKTPANYDELVKKRPFGPAEKYWVTPDPLKDAWTDKGPNLLHGVLRGHPFAQRYAAVARPVSDFLGDSARAIGAGHKVERFMFELGGLPRSVEDWMVKQQLRDNPQVEKLWR